ncbi:MAG: discoidin domain-containing protein [Kiritimatiellae bacterium]|nr:discoidin domain-containing protein [Kiritimatiellia bacterium]
MFAAITLAAWPGRADSVPQPAKSGLGGVEANDPEPVNIARGKSYTLDPAPNYSYCTDENDLTQLTDGEYSQGYFWVQKGTVGWLAIKKVAITIDLQQVEPIGGLSFNTAAGRAGVEWPAAVMIFTSEDGADFYYAGDLVEMCGRDGAPPAEGYAVHRYATNKLATKGRYIRLIFIIMGNYGPFCDEIEIYRGPDSLLAKPAAGMRAGDIKKFCFAKLIWRLMSRDAAMVREKAVRMGISPERQNAIEKKLARLEQSAGTADYDFITNAAHRAITPLDNIHAEILKVNARLLRESGFPPLFAWHNNRWDPLAAVETPIQPPAGPPHLLVEMMDNEYRAEVLNLMNTSDKPLTALLAIEKLPGGDNPGMIAVHQVEFVATQEGRMIADPLPPAKRTEKGWLIDLHPGMTRQVWLTFHPAGVKPGVYEGKIIVRPSENPLLVTRIYRWIRGLKSAQTLAVPLTLKIYPFRFPDRPRLSLGMWDYTDKPLYRPNFTEKNVKLAIADMREHFVDTPWAHRSSACWPEKDDFDAEGNLAKPLRTKGFDDWIGDWSGSRNYFIYLAVGTDFAGEPMGTPRFNKMVKSWAAAFAAHAKHMGVDPKQIGFILVDEPGKPEQYRINTIWAAQLKAAVPDFVLFTDASGWEKPNLELEKMLELHDIFCPHLPSYRGMDETKCKILRTTGGKQKTLWYYSAFGPARLFDPYYYHRLQAWHCWRNEAVGMGFWNYWNYYKEPEDTAWNELIPTNRKGMSFGVVYTTADSLVDGKHWEAVREGIEDYEYLAMLRDRIEELRSRGINTPEVEAAARLLKDAAGEVVPGLFEERLRDWSVDKDRSAADRCRVQILKALESIN